MVIARGSAFESIAILEYLVETGEISPDAYRVYEKQLDEISRMIYALIRKLEN